MKIIEKFINTQLEKLSKEMNEVANEMAEVEVKKQSSTSVTVISATMPPELTKRMIAIHFKIAMLNQFSA